MLAAARPEEYARIMQEAHLPIAAFGGAFLMVVCLGFFFDHEKDVHWIQWLERGVAKYATIRGIEVAFVLLVTMGFSRLPEGIDWRMVSHCWCCLIAVTTSIPLRFEMRLPDAWLSPRSALGRRMLGLRGGASMWMTHSF